MDRKRKKKEEIKALAGRIEFVEGAEGMRHKDKRLGIDKALREDLIDIAVAEERMKGRSRPFKDFLAETEKKTVRRHCLPFS